MELNCYNLTPNKDIRMGLPEYQNSINHLNDEANQIPRIQSESKWFSIIFKRCKCPENGQKVADIYEHVPYTVSSRIIISNHLCIFGQYSDSV